MSHSIILSDVIELITIGNEQYELEQWSDITGISRQELIDSATTITHHLVYEEPAYLNNLERSIADIYDEVIEDNLFDQQFNDDNQYEY